MAMTLTNHQPQPMKYLSILLLLFPILTTAQTWIELDDFPATERDDGTVFSIGNTVYCGNGRVPWWDMLADFYAFDVNSESWSTIAPMPEGEERQYASGFSNGEVGFVFGGVKENFLNDLWRYDPANNQWTPMTPLPGAVRGGTVAFVFDQTAIIAGGRNDNTIALNEVWAYDMETDTWEELSNLPYGGRWRAAGAVLNNKAYLLCGRNEQGHFKSDLLEYQPETDSWEWVSNFPLPGRSHTAMVALNDRLLVFGGIDSLNIAHNDLWQFDPFSGQWQELEPLPDIGRRGGMYWMWSNNFYYTTGLDTDGNRLKETWKYGWPTSVNTLPEKEPLLVFPNPANDHIRIAELDGSQGQVTIFNATGQPVWQQPTGESTDRISLQDLPNGWYRVVFENAQHRRSAAIVIAR